MPFLSEAVGSGWVSSHSARAGTVGSIPVSLPPCGFIAATMDLTVVAPAQRHGELIAYFSPACAVLREPQTMGIGGPTAAI